MNVLVINPNTRSITPKQINPDFFQIRALISTECEYLTVGCILELDDVLFCDQLTQSDCSCPSFYLPNSGFIKGNAVICGSDHVGDLANVESTLESLQRTIEFFDPVLPSVSA